MNTPNTPNVSASPASSDADRAGRTKPAGLPIEDLEVAFDKLENVRGGMPGPGVIFSDAGLKRSIQTLTRATELLHQIG